MPHNHSCYFHKQNPITHFCTRSQCTLPMCSECLPIHVQQHLDQNKNKGVITFLEAEHQAVSTLKNIIHTQTKYKSECHYKIQQVKSDLIKMIDLFFGDLKVKVDQQYLKISQIQKKLLKIQKGSLKNLIYFYSQAEIKHNDSFKMQIFSKIQNVETILRNSINQQRKKNIVQKPRTFQQQNTKKQQINQSQLKVKENMRERGYSFESNNERNNKLLSIKSSVNLQSQTYGIEQRHNSIHLNNNLTMVTESQNNKRLSSDKSMKIINKCQVQSKQATNRNMRRQYQYTDEDKYSGNTYKETYEVQSQRIKQIQRIRNREQQRQTQRQRKQQLMLIEEQTRERQKSVQRETNREKQRQLQRQRQLKRSIEAQKQIEKQKQRERQRQRQRQRQRERERERERQSQKLKLRALQVQSEKFKQNYKRQTEHFYSKNNFSYGQTQKYETKNYSLNHLQNKNQYIKIQEQGQRKPLEVADLNVQSRSATSVTGVGGKVSKSFTFSKQLQTKGLMSDNLFDMNKEVMSPQQIRKMLQKRIQQRSRLLLKHQNQNHTPPKKTQSIQYKATTNLQKSKDLSTNQFGVDVEGRWDTKDSIINQIYQDYRY